MQFNSHINFKKIAAAALNQSVRLVAAWLPDGKRQGQEWISINSTRADSSPGSFSVNLSSGCWADFATQDAGGDLISLVAYLDGTDQAQAALRIAEALGMDSGKAPAPPPQRAAPGQPQAPQAPAPHPNLAPIPEEALAVRPQAHPRHGQPTTCWTYRDLAGRPLFFQCRFDPPHGRKMFAPQSWTPAAGWQWKAPPAPRTLFGLEHLAARPNAPVLVVEGEKACTAAADLLPDYIAVTSLNGAQSPANTDWSPLAGRAIVRIWPDHDAPGRTFADHVARLVREAGAHRIESLDLAALALDPRTGEQRPLPPGWDAADAQADGWTAETLGRAARWESTDSATSWPPPQALGEQLRGRPFPSDALPAGIRSAIDEVQAFTQAPYPLVSTSCLAALSLACQALADVRRAPGLKGPCSLYFMVVAESGERKSSADERFLRPIRQWEDEAQEQYQLLLAEYRAACEALEAEKGGLKDRIRQESKAGKCTAEAKRQLRALERDTPTPPLEPRRLFADVTPEAFAFTLAKQCLTGGISSAEAGLVLGGHGMGKDSILRNLALGNALWDGPAFNIDRKTSASFRVKGVRSSISLMIQGEALLDFVERAGTLARGSGWFARFLLTCPDSTQGTRLYRPAPAAWPAYSRWCARVLELLRLDLPLADDGTLAPPVLDLDPDARAAWIAFHDAIERALADGGELRQIRDIASKVADSAARLACIFHVFEHGPQGSISRDHFAAASNIVAWHLHESRRFFGELSLPRELADAARLDTWLTRYAARERTTTLYKNEVRQTGPLRDGQRLDLALKELDNLDRLRITKEGRRIVLALNPALIADAAAAT